MPNQLKVDLLHLSLPEFSLESAHACVQLVHLLTLLNQMLVLLLQLTQDSTLGNLTLTTGSSLLLQTLLQLADLCLKLNPPQLEA